MKNKYIILLLIGLFVPSLVLAHEAYTKVEVDVFYTEKDASYYNLIEALNELSNEEETKDKFELEIHSYDDNLSKKAYKYASLNDNSKVIVYIGTMLNIGFSDKKYISENSDTISSLYTYYKKSIKEKILKEYALDYTGIVEELEEGKWDSYLNATTPVEIVDDTEDNDFDDYEELKNIVNNFKNSIKDDKMATNIIYPIIFLMLFSIVTNTLKNAIHKDK